MRDQRHRCWLGQSIRNLRRARRMTQADLALAIVDLMGGDSTANQSTVSRWESGRHDVSLRYEVPLAKALGSPTEILFAAPPDGWSPTAKMLAASAPQKAAA